MERMFDADGNLPHETGRHSSVYYYVYTLDAFAVMVDLCVQLGTDLWE